PNGEDVYNDGSTLNYTTAVKSGGTEYELPLITTPVTVDVTDTITPVDVTITATVTTPKIIDVNTKTDGSTGVNMYVESVNGNADLSVIKGTNHDGFGVLTTDTNGNFINESNGDTKELGKGEKIVVEFTGGKDVNSLDVSFAWRNNHETAKLTFINDGQVVGYATVDGDGKSTTKAFIQYYDDKEVKIGNPKPAEGSSDRVDKAFTFELPDSNGGIVSFDKVEFSAPQNKDDYLIHEIKYKEVLDPTVTDIVTNGGNVTFNIQVDENYPPQGKATAVVEINNIKYDVVLNATGRGTLTLDSSKLGTDLSNVEVKVLEVKGGNYEKVNPTEASFPFTPTVNTPTSTNDTISTDEDVSYTLKVTDFGEVSSSTKEFKITELPTPEIGKLFLNITKGETIFNPDGTEAVATQDSRVEITKGQIVTLGQVGAGKVEFVPKENSDVDGSFKFQVGDGNGKFSEEYTTTINVDAIADEPIVSIDVTKIGATTNPSIEPTQKIGTTDSIKNIRTNGDDIIEVNKELVMNDIINLGNGNDTLILNKNINQVTIDLGNGNDKVVINGQVNGTNNIHLGNGDDVIVINNIVTNNTHINGGNGKDTLFLSGNKSDYIFNLPTNNNGMIEGSITDKKGGGTIQYNQMETIVFGDGSYIGQKPQEEAPQTIFKVDISAALTDTDGSETLSVVIKGVPDKAKLYDLDGKEILPKNGEYNVTVPSGVKDISGSLTMKVPQSYKGEINLQIEARATETRDNEDKQNFKVTTDSDAVVTTVDETSNITVDKEGNDTNLVLVLDVSGSMVRTQKDGGGYTPVDLDGKGTTRFDVLKQSMISTIETYKAGGNTMVNMTLFAAGAKNLGWMIADEAIDYLNKLTMDKNAIVKHDGKKVLIGIDTGNNGKNTSDKFVESNQTDYRDALDETIRNVKMEYSGQASVKAVGYFVSDGAPNENTNKVNSSNTTIIKTWKEFIESNNIDLKVIGVGTPEDNKSALKYLKIVNVGGEDVIVIDEPSSIETIILGTVEGTVFGDVTDNFSAGDGKVTIDSIEVGNQTYTKDTMPKSGLQLDGEGKLLFDFETGKYAYNGNGADITEDKTKSFKVNVSDENGDENSFNVNFELNKEQNDGVFSFKEGGDINFSNLENIVNLKEINLDNGKENKLSLTLDDVLKLSGDDGKIKITGDQFDSVAFKNTTGENGQAQTWSKNAGTGEDAGFDIYVNSGDSTLQVKVEQPISDGITN
ncbi:hypothetical protein OZY48_10580, partial [Aliarcobacter cryaerophilus]|uniref:hypothetical protein n=1 Tax=Aliarcobacter cryaerophilus TaxID=28198 RepID=UPI003BAFE6DC